MMSASGHSADHAAGEGGDRAAGAPRSMQAAIGRAYALGRVGAGTGLLAAPGLGARLLGDPAARHSARLLGVRDLLLAAGALLATPGSSTWRRAMALCAAADAADALSSAARLRRREPAALVVTLAAIAGTATGAWLAFAAGQVRSRDNDAALSCT